MPTYRYIVLDAYPLSNAAVTPAHPSTTPNESEQCHQWMIDCEAVGATLIVPAIAYYEGVRELYERKATAKIARFEAFCFNSSRFVPLTVEHLTEAAKLWGRLRNQGVPTADRLALDADAIFAAQVLSLGLPSGDYVVATRNSRHLPRFGLPIEQWENVTP